MVADDEEALRLFLKLATAAHGGDRKSASARIKTDIISLDPKHGTSRAYTLSRLKRHAPELFARVERKELSPHAGAARSPRKA